VSGAAPAQLTGSAPPPPPALPPPPAPSVPHPSALAQQQELELQRQQQEKQQQVQLRGSRAPAPSLLSIPAVCGARGQYVTDSCIGVDVSLHANAVYVPCIARWEKFIVEPVRSHTSRRGGSRSRNKLRTRCLPQVRYVVCTRDVSKAPRGTSPQQLIVYDACVSFQMLHESAKQCWVREGGRVLLSGFLL
jgi:hypothetical protein